MRALLAATAVLIFGTACTSTGGFAADEPNPQGLEAGELAALPLPPGTAPFGPPSQKDGTVTQSFKATGLQPGDVAQFYAEALPNRGWATSTWPAESGDHRWQGQWTRNERLLQITSEPDVDDGAGDGNGAAASQFDLVLSAAPPAGAG